MQNKKQTPSRPYFIAIKKFKKSFARPLFSVNSKKKKNLPDRLLILDKKSDASLIILVRSDYKKQEVQTVVSSW